MRRARKSIRRRAKSSKKKSNKEELQHKKPSTRKKASGRSLNNILMNIAMISGFSTVIGTMFTWFTSMYLTENEYGQ